MDSRASNDVKNDLKESMTVHESEMDVSGHHHPELTPAFEAGKSCREGNSGGYYCLFWVGGKKHIYKCTKVYTVCSEIYSKKVRL